MKVIRNGKEIERKPKDINYDKNLNIRVSSELMNNLRSIANNKEVTFARVVRAALDEYIKKNLK